MSPAAWLDGAERVESSHSDGGTYNGDPWRLVLHTVEGEPSDVTGCRNVAASNPYPPHLWYHRQLRWLGQTVPLDRSAFALEHPGGTYETNKAGALQVELYGFAGPNANNDGTDTWTDDELVNIAEDVVARIIAAGYPINLERVAPTTGSDGYGSGGAVRMSTDEWRSFDGICVHANVPANEHWDAGALNLARIAQAAGGAAPAPEQREDIMPLHLIVGDKPEWYVTDLVTKRYVNSPDEAARIVVRTVALGGVIEQNGENGPVYYEQDDVDAIPTIG